MPHLCILPGGKLSLNDHCPMRLNPRMGAHQFNGGPVTHGEARKAAVQFPTAKSAEAFVAAPDSFVLPLVPHAGRM